MKKHSNEVLEAYRDYKKLEEELALKEKAAIEDAANSKAQLTNKIYNTRYIREAREQKRSKLLEAARNEVFSTVMKAIYITALEAETLTDEGLILAEDMVDNWIKERGGASKILNPVCNNTYLISRISQIVEDSSKEIVKDIESEDKSDEDVNDSVDEKKEKALDSTGEFIQAADKEDIKDMLGDIVDQIQDKSEEDGKEQAESDGVEATSDNDDKADGVEKTQDDAEVDGDGAEETEPETDEGDSDDSTDDIDLDDESEDTEDSDDNAPAEPDDEESEDEDKEAATTDTEESEGDEAEESNDEDESDEDDDIDLDADLEVDDSEEDEESDEDESDEDDEDDSDEDEEEDDSDIELDDDSEDDEESDEEDEIDGEIDTVEDEIEDEEDFGEPLDDDGVDSDISVDGDMDNDGKIFRDLEKEEDVQKAIELIRTRVADAEETFIRNNAEDKKKIEELLDKISNNVKTVEDLEDKNPKKAEIAKEFVAYDKRKISDITNNRPLTVFERMARIDMTNIVTNEAAREKFLTEEGELDVDLVVERAKIMYGFLETLNTMQLEKVDANYISNILNTMK